MRLVPSVTQGRKKDFCFRFLKKAFTFYYYQFSIQVRNYR